MRLKAHQILTVASMGKRLKVTAIFHDDDEANSYMEKHRDEGVVAVFEPYILVANLTDSGES